jgi:putative DNA primase/helicase
VVDTGGGWQAFYKLAEPIDAQGEGKLLLERWQTTSARIASESGVHLDNTADLARLLRMVGSVNTKFPEGSQPTVQTIFLDPSRQYGLDDLDEVLDMPEVRAEPVELDPARPGDDYSAQATVADLETLLVEIGMGDFRDGHTDLRRFSRPGKAKATTGSIYDDADALRVVFWSSDAEVTSHGIEPRRPYTAFQLRTLIRQRSDTSEAFTATAAELRTEGYGAQPVIEVTVDGQPVEPFPAGLRSNDTDNAERFLHLHRDRVRYVMAWKSWLIWDGTLWQSDPDAVLAHELAKEVSRHLYLELGAPGLDEDRRKRAAQWAATSASASKIAAMVKLARGMPGVIVDHEDLDNDPWALGVANGWIDLRDGSFHAPNPAKLMTLVAPVAFDPDAKAPRWEKALAEWLPDPEVRAYFQRLVGEAIVGTVRDHLLVLIYGRGRNGKGTAIDTLANMLGPYFVPPHKSLLLQLKHDSHSTEKAALFRIRLAVAAETESTIKLAEASVKELTGGDRLSARRLYENPCATAHSCLHRLGENL